ncbi:MAG: response regulator transcription factor [Alphaproteobacteria bacterium]|nr:response regulator transcription factor [Alphaproteobacteria bacterium]
MSEAAPHILVVDDDTRLRGLLRRYLSDNGFRVSTAEDAAQARDRMRGMAFDLMVLDRMMPGEGGLALAEALNRAGQAIPILMLTAMGEVEDRIQGLEAGAEDYLVKPFEPRELLLRIQAILRRHSGGARAAAAAPEAAALRFGRLTFDRAHGELSDGAGPVRLTSAEAGLLGALAGDVGTVMSRDMLGQVSGAGGNARTIDVQVTRLRRKIEPDPKFPRYLQTVRGRGYVLKPD